MVLPASTLASCITSTIRYTLSAIFCADKVWQSLRVFGGIRRFPVVTDAIIGQSCLFGMSWMPKVAFKEQRTLTGLQSFASVVWEVTPGSCRQSAGQDCV